MLEKNVPGIKAEMAGVCGVVAVSDSSPEAAALAGTTATPVKAGVGLTYSALQGYKGPHVWGRSCFPKAPRYQKRPEVTSRISAATRPGILKEILG